MLHRHLGRRDFGGIFFGAILLLVGAFYLLRNTLGFDIGELNWDAIWPILVLGLGVAVLLGALTRGEGGEPPS